MPSEFQWNDTLVKEFMLTYNKIDKLIDGADPIIKTMQEWKQSKIKEKERTKVKISQEFGSTMKHHVSGDGFYHPYRLEVYGEELTNEQKNKLQSGCESILNNEQPKEEKSFSKQVDDYVNETLSKEETKNKEWEIVGYLAKGYLGESNVVFKKDKAGNFICNFKYTIGKPLWETEERLKKEATIHSVKRLSDGEVFTVGDEVDITFGTYEGKDTIKGFEILGEDLKVLFTPNIYWFLAHVFHSKPTTQPLSGEFITKEECERQKRELFNQARKQIGVEWTVNYKYKTYEDYQQSLK